NNPYEAAAIRGAGVDLAVRGRVYDAPQVTAIAINDGSIQRSVIRSLRVTFDRTVLLDPGTFVLTRQGGSPVTVTVATQIVAGQTVATLTPTGSGTEFGSLVDGRYSLTVVASKVHDPAVTALTMTADATTTFHRLFGDADGNARVDVVDFAAIRLSLFGNAMTFDFNNDGTVSTADILQFRSRFLQGI
ncbi:MAG: hypothetical protein K1X57_06755, partial [Gemmataceae bacterium]|nr:hypothetical protein [Gemmataceae bacterium]